MPEPQRLLFDVTRLVRSGLHTGIQRVVRCLLSVCAEQARKAEGVVVAPVSCEGKAWLAYPALAAHPLQGSALEEITEPLPITPGAGDVLLFFDASWYIEPWPAVDEAMNRGARLVGMVHDLLPLQHPDWFRAGLAKHFSTHLHALSVRADLLFVPSAVVAKPLRQRLGHAAPPIEILAHGGDFLCAAPAHLPRVSSDPAPATSRPFHLVVSTLEPRKQHARVLDAFERLWQAGHDHALVLVGAAGWGVDDLLDRLRGHPQHGRRLFHFAALSDIQLAGLYHDAHSLIYLSHDEGFGLPVLEAAMLGCPVIAADIPVLREVGGRWPHFVAAGDTDALVAAILDHAVRPCPVVGTPPRRTWQDAGQQLVERLVAHGLLHRRPANSETPFAGAL